MAGALGLRLGGPRAYGGVRRWTARVWATDAARRAAEDISRAFAVYRRAIAIALACFASQAAAVAWA